MTCSACQQRHPKGGGLYRLDCPACVRALILSAPKGPARDAMVAHVRRHAAAETIEAARAMRDPKSGGGE